MVLQTAMHLPLVEPSYRALRIGLAPLDITSLGDEKDLFGKPRCIGKELVVLDNESLHFTSDLPSLTSRISNKFTKES